MIAVRHTIRAGNKVAAGKRVPLAAATLLSLLLAFTFIPASPASPGFTAPVNISPGSFTTDNQGPQIALDAGGHAHVAWTGSTGTGQVYYATNAGGSWTAPLRLSTGTGNSGPRIAVGSDGHPHVVWQAGDGYIYYTTNAGSGWSTPEAVSTTVTNYGEIKMALDSGNHPVVVWRGGDGNIYYTTKASGSWPAGPTLISTTSSDNYNPQMALDSGNHPHVIWSIYSSERVYYTTNAGGSWLASPVLVPSTSSYDTNTQIAVDSGGHPHVIWDGYDFDAGSRGIYYTTNAGGSWLASPNVLYGDGSYGRIAVAGTVVHVVLQGYKYGGNQINYVTGAVGSWSGPVTIPTTTLGNSNLNIVLDTGGKPHVAWCTSDGNSILYSTNAGGSWLASPNVLSSTFTGNNAPRIALDSGNHAHVVWSGWDAPTTQILYTTGTAGNWSAPYQVSSDVPANQSNNNKSPQVVVDSGNRPHAVWLGYNGQDQVCYSTDPGSGWTEPRVLSDNSYVSHDPRIAVGSDGHPHAVWWANARNWSNCYVFYSTDQGSGWSPPVTLATLGPGPCEADIAVDSNNHPHVVWHSSSEAYYSTNAGGSWLATPDILFNNSVIGMPRIAMDSGDVAHVAWIGFSSRYRLFYAAGNAGNWSTPQIISTGDDYNEDPQLALDSSGNAHVVWRSEGQPSYYIRYTTNAGGSWLTSPVVLSGASTENQTAKIATDPAGHAHVVWEGLDGDAKAQVYYSTNADGSWSDPPAVISNDPDTNHYAPQVAVDSSGHVYSIWYGTSSGTHVFYSTNTGAGWSAPLLESTNSESNSSPQIALDSREQPHVVWAGWDNVETNRIWYSVEFKNAVTATVPGGHGTAEPARQYVADGGTAAVDLVPEAGYHVESLTDNGAPVTLADPYVIENVSADHDVEVAFSNLHTIEASAGEGGSISPSGSVIVVNGSDQTFNITPDEGYRVTDVLVDGVSVGPAATYTFSAVTADHTIEASFARNTWYLAEGATDGGMETWVLVQNPGDTEVTVDLTLMTKDGPTAPKGLQGVAIPAGARASFNMGSFVTTYEVSTMVTATGGDVVCERSMYGNDRAWGTDSVGVTVPASRWYLAEGATDGGMETFLLLQNPNLSEVKVDVDFMTSSGRVEGPRGYIIEAQSRATLVLSDYLTDYNVSTMVTARGGDVVCERSMYGNDRTWGTDSIGASAPALVWYLAEGCTVDMDTWVLVQNPGDSEVTVDLTLMTGSGPTAPADLQDVVIAANSRESFNLGEYVQTNQVSTMVTATGGVVCERAMYGADRVWGTDSIGAYVPAPIWYLAEGATDGGMETWVLVQNPNGTPLEVDLTFMTPEGPQAGPRNVVIGAFSRTSFNVGDYVTGYDVSTRVTATGGGVVVERAMYGNSRTWATDSIGYAP